jgi:hypothetical protein
VIAQVVRAGGIRRPGARRPITTAASWRATTRFTGGEGLGPGDGRPMCWVQAASAVLRAMSSCSAARSVLLLVSEQPLALPGSADQLCSKLI